MRQNLISIIQKARQAYLDEGFIILGFFGSRARGEERPDSDLDLLYDTNQMFEQRYPFWDRYARIAEISLQLEKVIGIKVDLVERKALDSIGEYFILPEVIHVA